MKKRLTIWSGLAVLTGLAFLPLVAAFEAHVINVTATIENALFVHPESREFGLVFPQLYFEQGTFITFSESFSTTDQKRVTKIDYVIKQKPQCVDGDGHLVKVGEDITGKFVCPKGTTVRPNLCPYLSKTWDSPVPDDKHVSVPAFHDPGAIAKGTLDKLGKRVGDNWIIDLAVPCFRGQCAQDWPSFVHSKNPKADPEKFKADPADEHKIFGCDLWVEVTKIYK